MPTFTKHLRDVFRLETLMAFAIGSLVGGSCRHWHPWRRHWSPTHHGHERHAADHFGTHLLAGLVRPGHGSKAGTGGSRWCFHCLFFNVYQGVKEVSPVRGVGQCPYVAPASASCCAMFAQRHQLVFSSLHTSVGLASGRGGGEYLGPAMSLSDLAGRRQRHQYGDGGILVLTVSRSALDALVGRNGEAPDEVAAPQRRASKVELTVGWRRLKPRVQPAFEGHED
jgi:hypothetical protein